MSNSDVVNPGDRVRLTASSEFSYEVACIKQFPHGMMVGIYDEPPGKHVDYWNPHDLFKVNETIQQESKKP